MSGSIQKLWTIAMLSFLYSHCAYADEPPALEHNPFARPPSNVVPDRGLAETTVDENGTPDLKATLVGDKQRLANIAGKMFRPGDDISGYRLVEVHEDHAVFLKGNDYLTLYVKPEMIEEDE